MTSLDIEVEDETEEGQLNDIFDTITAISHPLLDGLSIDFEEPPVAPPKAVRAAKVVLKWEEWLDAIQTQPGRWLKVFEFVGENAKPNARARARSMRNRLVKVRPDSIWNILATEDRDETGHLNGVWKVYAQYERPATAAEVIERSEKHTAAVNRGKAAAAAREAARSK